MIAADTLSLAEFGVIGGYSAIVALVTVFVLWSTGVIKLPARPVEIPAPVDPPDPWQFASPTKVGTLLFTSDGDRKGEIGRLGEMLTRLIYAARGYVYIDCKYGPDNGIDGIFVRDREMAALTRGDSSQLTEIIVTETKANSGAMAEGDLSNDWIVERLERANRHPNLDLIQPHIIEGFRTGVPRVHRRYWHHHFDSGATVVKELGRDGKTDLLWRESPLAGAIECVFLEALKTKWRFKWKEGETPAAESASPSETPGLIAAE